jgi:hypothetical protein
MTGALATEPRTLQSLTEQQRQELFDVLQQRLPAAWGAMRLNLGGESIVVVPSVTLDRVVDRRAPTQAYEERFLFLLLLLRQPRLLTTPGRYPESCQVAAPSRLGPRRIAGAADGQGAGATSDDRANPGAHSRPE